MGNGEDRMKTFVSIQGIRSTAGLTAKTAVMAVACFAVTLAGGCKKKEQAPPPPPPSVEVTQVVAKDTPIVFEYVAQTQSSHQVNIQARVNGFLEKRTYTEGAVVKTGDVLFVMDKKPYQAQVEAAVAALGKQKAAMETARLNLERTKPLTAKNALSQKDLDDATGAYQSAAAAVDMAKAQLETAQLNLSYCTINSPVNGITGAAQQQDGTYLSQANSLLTTVAVLSPMWVNFSLSENELKSYRDQIAKGQIRPPKDQNYVIEIVQVDGSIFPQTGRITFADPSFNPQTGTFLIRASVNNPNGSTSSQPVCPRPYEGGHPPQRDRRAAAGGAAGCQRTLCLGHKQGEQGGGTAGSGGRPDRQRLVHHRRAQRR